MNVSHHSSLLRGLNLNEIVLDCPATAYLPPDNGRPTVKLQLLLIESVCHYFQIKLL